MFRTKFIGVLYRKILKPVLFQFDPERVHDHFIHVGQFLGRFRGMRAVLRAMFVYRNPVLEQEICGIHFENPVGLSAGFDKNGHLSQVLPDVGFSYMQVGSVTTRAYEGNPKPRLHRLKKSRGLVVYYGLKNEGVRPIAKRVKRHKKRFPLSFSVAKTNDKDSVGLKEGIADYCDSLKVLEKEKCADFYTINISCPNTFGGEPFSDPERLKALLSAIQKLKIKRPIFLKMPIGLSWKPFKELCEIALKHEVHGVVIGNLQKNHKHKSIVDPIPSGMKGGVSGKPCQKAALHLVRQTYKAFGDDLVIVGVGGIFNADDAYEYIQAGASLLQLITGMIFQGPQVIAEINHGLAKRLEADGFSTISEAVGSGHPS